MIDVIIGLIAFGIICTSIGYWAGQHSLRRLIDLKDAEIETLKVRLNTIWGTFGGDVG